MGRFPIQLLSEDNTLSTRYSIPRNDLYSNLSTVWFLVSVNFTTQNYGFR